MATKLSVIEEQWAEDCKIDRFNLVSESQRSPLLHSKYSKLLNEERKILIAMIRDFKRTKLEARQFMINPTANNPKGFLSKIPKGQRIIKSDYDSMIDGDESVSQEEAKVSLQKAKVEYIESILWQIKDRRAIIYNMISLLKFESGE